MRNFTAFILVVISLIGTRPCQAQQIYGSTLVTTGTQYTYEYNASTALSNPRWALGAGKGIVDEVTNNGLTYTAKITWNTIGSETLAFLDGTNLLAQLSITLQAPLPSVPTALAATNVTSTSFTANWESVNGAASYRLDVSTVNDFSTFVSGYEDKTVLATSYSVTGLVPGTSYYYRIRSENGSGASQPSNSITSITVLPAPVATPATAITSSSFTANWTASSGAISYRLDVALQSDFSQFLNGYGNLEVNSTSKKVTGLQASTTYYYRVRAVGTTSSSPNSNTISAGVLDYNYIRTIDVTVPGKTTLSQVDQLTENDATTSFVFFDGLGHPIQNVIVKGSHSKKDVVQPIAYDAFGRETKKYLPYTDSSSPGWYKDDALKDPEATGPPAQQYISGKQYDFYQSGGDLAQDEHPYSETRFEASPLNRVFEQGSPGSNWQPDATDAYTSRDRTTKAAYGTNGINEVLSWSYISPTTTYPLGLVATGTTAPEYYGANQLYKTRTKDEQHHEVIEYKDKEDRVVLKRVQAVVEGTPAINDTNRVHKAAL